jgi:hypothetical protein
VEDHATGRGIGSAGEGPGWACDYVREAVQECLWSAHRAAGSPAMDRVSVLNQIDVMFGDLSSRGSGYWQIRLDTGPSGAEFKIRRGEGLPDPGQLPLVETIRLGAAPGRPATPAAGCAAADRPDDSQPTGRSTRQDKPPDPEPEPVRLRRAEDGPVALIRCHPSPGPDQVTDGGVAALTALCQWLSDLHNHDLLIPSDQIPLTPNSDQAAEVRQAALVVAYDPGNGQGAWSRRVRPAPVPAAHDPGSPQARPAADLPPASREDQPALQRDDGGPQVSPVEQAIPGVTAGDDSGQAAAQAKNAGHSHRPPGDGDTSQPGPGQHTSLASPRQGNSPRPPWPGPGAPRNAGRPGVPGTARGGEPLGNALTGPLQAQADPAARLDMLRSALRAAGSVLPPDPQFARLPREDQLSRLADLHKPPGSAWIVTAPSSRHGHPAEETTLLTMPYPGRNAGTAPPPGAVAGDGAAGQFLYVIDDAVLDTLIRAVLGPPGARGVGYVQVISIIEITIQPRLIVVKVVTMTAGAFLNAHGLGLLAPASGRILTWILVRMLDTLLGPGRRFSRLQWLLGWLEISLYARDGRLGSSPGFRSKLAHWLNRLWNGTRRRPDPTGPPAEDIHTEPPFTPPPDPNGPFDPPYQPGPEPPAPPPPNPPGGRQPPKPGAPGRPIDPPADGGRTPAAAPESDGQPVRYRGPLALPSRADDGQVPVAPRPAALGAPGRPIDPPADGGRTPAAAPESDGQPVRPGAVPSGNRRDEAPSRDRIPGRGISGPGGR